EDFGGKRDCIGRRYRAIRPHLEHQLVVVGHLTYARVLHSVVDLTNRREDGVDWNRTKRHRRALVLLGTNVPTTNPYRQFHDQRTLLVEGRDQVIGVEDLEAVDQLNVTRYDWPR